MITFGFGILISVLGIIGWFHVEAKPFIGGATRSKLPSKRKSSLILVISLLGILSLPLSNHHTLIWHTIAIIIMIGSTMRDFWEFNPELHSQTPAELNQRLRQLTLQLQRLREKEQLDTLLTKTQHAHFAMVQFNERFELILTTIERHIFFGNEPQTVKLITLFARHLREVLHEGSMPFLPLASTIGHTQTAIELLSKLTGNRMRCDIDDGMLEESSLQRHTESLLIVPWILEVLWPYFQLAERVQISTNHILIQWDASEYQIDVDIICNHVDPKTGIESSITRTKSFKLLGSPWFNENSEILQGMELNLGETQRLELHPS